MKKIVILAVILLTVPVFSMQQVRAVDQPMVSVNPNHFELNLTAGARINKSITVVWTGDYPIVVFFQKTISPDDKGMNLWFGEDPVSMLPGTSKKVNMSVRALVNIAPGHYKIDIYAIADTNKLAELYNMTAQLKAQIAVLEGKIRNMTGTDVSGLLATINGLKSTIDSLNTKIANMKQEPAKATDNSLLLYVIIVFLVIIIVLIFFLWRKSQYTEEIIEEEEERQFEDRVDTSGTRVPIKRAQQRYVPDVDTRDVTERIRQKKRWVHGPNE